MAKLGVIEHWVSRAAWDADDPDCSDALPVSGVNRVFVHYTAAEADRQMLHSNCAGRWKAVQDFHLNGRGWCDIAYTIGVCRHGFAHEGRGFGKKTAATGPCNGDSYAVVFMGHDKVGRDDVGSAGRETIAECVAEIERRKKGVVQVKGHRDCMPTSCPGDELYTWIRSPAFRRLVNAQKVGGQLIDVWQCRAGKRTLKQIKAGAVDGKSALDRLLAWMAVNETKIKNAEREHGAVAIRRVMVPA